MIQDIVFTPFFHETSGRLCSQDTIASLKFPIQKAYAYLTSDPDELISRQNIFRDLLGIDGLYRLFCGAMEKLDDLAGLARKIGDVSSETNEAILYSMMELRSFTEAVDFFHDGMETFDHSRLASDHLRRFFASIAALHADSEFTGLKEWLDSLDTKIRRIRSLTVGVNLDAQLDVTEIGIVSINEHPFVSASPLDRAFRKEQVPHEYECITTVGMRESGSLIEKRNIVINREFYSSMNGLMRASLKNLRKYLNNSVQAGVRSLLAIQEDCAFLTRTAAYMFRMKEGKFPLTFPQVSDRCRILKLYNPLLLESMSAKKIVPSDVSFDEARRIYVLTGPNSGGKSVYVTEVGIAQMLFQLGLPVPAITAEMKIYDSIVTHFIVETKKESESRLANEAVRLKESLEMVGKNTLFLLDETFSSTSAFDALFLAEALLKHLAATGCHAVYVTHLHELTARLNEMRERGTETAVNMLSAKVENGRRTYEIVPYEGNEMNSSLARDIVIENGLGFLFGE